MSTIDKVKETLSKINYACMATVNQDGSPHNSPLVFLYDENFEYIYWGSHPDALHSQNVLRTGQAYFAAYDAIGGGPGVYIQAEQAAIVSEVELDEALRVHNHFRSKLGKKSIEKAYYAVDMPQKMWKAKVVTVWTNDFERDANGRLQKDFKIKIELNELQEMWQ